MLRNPHPVALCTVLTTHFCAPTAEGLGDRHIDVPEDPKPTKRLAFLVQAPRSHVVESTHPMRRRAHLACGYCAPACSPSTDASKRAAPPPRKWLRLRRHQLRRIPSQRRRKAQDDEEDEDQRGATSHTQGRRGGTRRPAERAGAFAERARGAAAALRRDPRGRGGRGRTAARDDGAPAFLVRRRRPSPGFVNFLYAFELLALATAFKLRMLTHPGLLLDVGIVSVPPASFVSSARRWRYEGRTSRRCRRMSGRRRRGSTATRERGSTGGHSRRVKKSAK